MTPEDSGPSWSWIFKIPPNAKRRLPFSFRFLIWLPADAYGSFVARPARNASVKILSLCFIPALQELRNLDPGGLAVCACGVHGGLKLAREHSESRARVCHFARRHLMTYLMTQAHELRVPDFILAEHEAARGEKSFVEIGSSHFVVCFHHPVRCWPHAVQSHCSLFLPEDGCSSWRGTFAAADSSD